MKKITSLNNEEIKNIVKLQESRERKKQNLFIIEGLRAFATAIEANLILKQVYITENNVDSVKQFCSDDQITLVTELIMNKISSATTPSGILGAFNIPQNKNKITEGIVLANISDPGNMGTLIRTAASCNLRTVIVIEGVDPWSPKVVQASAGTIALVNIVQLSWEKLISQNLILQKNKLQLYGLVVHGGDSIKNIKIDDALLVIGNEANGLPLQWQEQCDKLLTLPMPGETESLNAAIAGSIALYITSVLNCNYKNY